MAESGAASSYRIYRNILLVAFRGGLVLLTGVFFVIGTAVGFPRHCHYVPSSCRP